jgi:hypothetical protein
MKFNDLKNFLKEESGQHTTNIYMPSIKRDISFKPITTADVKTLSRIGIFNEFDINNELLKLSLFDKLSIETKESCGIDSETILPIDFLSFLIGIRKLLNNELSFSFTCKSCSKKFDSTINLEAEFENYIFGFNPKHLTYEKIDNQNNIWKFELENYTMKNYLYFRYYIDRVSDIDSNNPDVMNEAVYSRPALYIKSISKNNEEIEDWNDHLITDKIHLLNLLPSEVIVNTSSKMNDPESSLSNFIKANFDEEKIFTKIAEKTTVCPHCKEEYQGVYKFDDFFMF